MLHVWYGVDHESKFPGTAEGGEGWQEDRKRHSGTGGGAVFDQTSDTMNGHSPATPEPDTPDYVPSLTHTHQQLHIQHSAVWCLIICRLGWLYGHAYFFAL